MLIVYLSLPSHKEAGSTHNGRRCLPFDYTPTLDELFSRATLCYVTGLALITPVELPVDRIDTYQLGPCRGSYDGATVHVFRSNRELYIQENFGDESALQLADSYESLLYFYHSIVHGQITGEYHQKLLQ